MHGCVRARIHCCAHLLALALLWTSAGCVASTSPHRCRDGRSRERLHQDKKAKPVPSAGVSITGLVLSPETVRIPPGGLTLKDAIDRVGGWIPTQPINLLVGLTRDQTTTYFSAALVEASDLVAGIPLRSGDSVQVLKWYTTELARAQTLKITPQGNDKANLPAAEKIERDDEVDIDWGTLQATLFPNKKDIPARFHLPIRMSAEEGFVLNKARTEVKWGDQYPTLAGILAGSRLFRDPASDPRGFAGLVVVVLRRAAGDHVHEYVFIARRSNPKDTSPNVTAEKELLKSVLLFPNDEIEVTYPERVQVVLSSLLLPFVERQLR